MKVRRLNRTGYFIKQPGNPGSYSKQDIVREGQFYLQIQKERGLSEISRLLPGLVLYDEKRPLLVTEIVPNGLSFGELISSAEYEHATSAASQLGNLMARFHLTFQSFREFSILRTLPAFIPSVSQIIRPAPEMFAHMSSGQLELLKIIQKYDYLADAVSKVFSDWTAETLIHGDIRFENLIFINAAEKKKRDERLVLVDWEFVGPGDQAWDIAGVFEEFLRLFISSISASGKEAPEEIIKSAKFPVDKLQGCLRSFWDQYRKAALLDCLDSNNLLLKSARFCAVRLLQTSYEILYSSSEVSNLSIYMIQLCANILDNTPLAVSELLGLLFLELVS